MASSALKTDFVDKFDSMGENKFYKFLLCYAINKLIKIRDGEYKGNFSPEIEFLEYSDKFLSLYRRDDKRLYLDISRIFKKAANKIYRLMLKKEMTEINAKFLNVV